MCNIITKNILYRNNLCIAPVIFGIFKPKCHNILTLIQA